MSLSIGLFSLERMYMSLYFVRHGQTDWNQQGKLQGRSDIPLNAIGIQQAKDTSRLLKDVSIEKIFCSPLTRAMQTAAILQEVTKCDIVYDDRLKDRCFGDLEGKKMNTITTYLWDFQALPCPHAEAMDAFFQRVQEFLKEITTDLRTHDYLIVAHGGVYLPVHEYFKGLQREQDLMKIVPKNCTLTKFDASLSILV